jgi:hypothetical protein
MEAHPRMHFLIILRLEMKAAGHLHLFSKIKSATQSPSRRGRSLQRSQEGGRSRGLKAAEVPRLRSSLHQRPKDDEGGRSKVYQMDDVTRWTHITFLFMRHENIYKSQRTVMTP